MASNKPVGQSWESYTDALFHQAEREGRFKNLSGAGKPIPGLDEPYDENWWLKQMLKREDLSALPDTLRFKLELQKELEQLPRIPLEAQLREKISQINARIRMMNASSVDGPPLNLNMLDAEALIERWRANRARSEQKAVI
jgi:hypothetical protein